MEIKDYSTELEQILKGIDMNGHPQVVKVNLPDNDKGFMTGNGEGCWAWIIDPEDIDKYDKGEGVFEVALLNSSVYYMPILKWGHIVLVKGRGIDNRPVMSKEWAVQVGLYE